jgi:nanoRNase/pAp phosphatase (c-di-AMP/oligoRNAs hydrolase)
MGFRLPNGKILLLMHENADLDAICSAAIMQRYLKSKKIDSKLGVPSHINEQSISFAFKEKISFIINPKLNEFDSIIIFDMNDYDQLGKLKDEFILLQKKKKLDIFVFDHHEIEKRSICKGKNSFVNPKATSATQVLYEILGKNNFDKKMYFYVCLGILEDTGNFITGTVDTFIGFADCLKKSGKKYSDLLEITQEKLSGNERHAFLQAAKRAQLYNFGGVIVAVSYLSFYQGQSATKLLDFGADIALVAGTDKKGITSMSGRANSVFKESKNFNLMTHLFKPIQKKFGGEIGGHSGAAQWKGKIEPKKILSESLEIILVKF